MNLFFKLALTVITSALLLVGGIFTGENLYQPVQTQSFGSFSPVQGQTYTLQGAGVTATQNTIPLASFTTPDGRAITMAMFGGTIGYGTLEPNTNSKIEDITFSGVTQNSNGSATLTGVTRGNDFVTPYAASTTLSKAHAGGSYFILSNTAGFYGQQFLFANNTSTSTAVMVFSSTTPPRYDADPIWANFSTQVLADVSYVNSVVAAGAANASTIVKGIIQIATATQTAAGTATGSTGALLVPPNSLFNATQSATTIIPVTNTSGKLSQAFLDLTQAFAWSGLQTFNAGLLNTASSTFNPGTLHVGSIVLAPHFGGTGTDGTLAISSGTTTIALGTANFYEKDYTSIALTGTGSLNFSSAATSSSGVTVVLKSTGACTFTSSSKTMIDLRWLGGGLGTAAATAGIGESIGGGGGGGGGSTASQGASGGVRSFGNSNTDGLPGIGGVQLPALASSTNLALPGGNGTAGVADTGTAGAAGLGAGGLYIECGGAYNFTTGGFMASGANAGSGGASNGTGSGGGGGGGGGAGNILVRYGSLTADSGTYSTSAGAGGNGGAANGALAGNGGGQGSDGSHLEVLNTTNY